MAKQPKQIGVKMDPNMVEQIDRLADMHHRDRSGEVIHACALYIAAHEPPRSPESYYAVLQALEELRSKMLDDLKQVQKGNSGWVKAEQGWFK